MGTNNINMNSENTEQIVNDLLEKYIVLTKKTDEE